jgi:hypothetical protein
MTDGIVIGEIHLAPDGKTPLFRRIRHDYEAGTEVGKIARPCDHGAFLLDEKWSSVTCGKCNVVVPAFDALMTLVAHWDRLKADAAQRERATADLNRAELRRLERLRCFDDAERAEITKAIRDRSATARQLADVADRFGGLEDERRAARRRERRALKGKE